MAGRCSDGLAGAVTLTNLIRVMPAEGRVSEQLDGLAAADGQGLLRVAVNGEDRAFTRGLSVAGMIVELGLTSGKVAVERNEAIVPRSRYGDVLLAPGDRFEIVHFIGGG